MKNVILSILLILVSLNAMVADKISAVVGNEIILDSEVRQVVEQQLSMGAPISREQLYKDVLNSLIAAKVIYDVAKKDTTISVSDKEIEEEVDYRINSVLARVGGEAGLAANYNTTVQKLKTSYRPEITKNLFVDKLKRKRMSKEKINRHEIEAFYAQFKDSLPDIKETINLSQVLVSFDNKSNLDEQVLAQLTKIRARILADSISFEDAAKSFSQDPGSAVNGGNLGLISRDDLVPEFAMAAYNLTAGQMSQPIKSQFGFHLIKLIEKVGEKINCSHILIKPSISNEAEGAALQKITLVADSISNRLMTFEEAVKRYSDDEKSRSQNGMIGVMELEDLDNNFKEAFNGLSSGDITKPVKTDKGYLLFKIIEKESAHKVELEKDYRRLQEWALNRKRDQSLQLWIEDLKKQVYIEVK